MTADVTDVEKIQGSKLRMPTADGATAPPGTGIENHQLIKSCDGDSYDICGPVFPFPKGERKGSTEASFLNTDRTQTSQLGTSLPFQGLSVHNVSPTSM